MKTLTVLVLTIILSACATHSGMTPQEREAMWKITHSDNAGRS